MFVLSQSAQSYLASCGELDGEVLGLKEANALMKSEYEITAEKSQEQTVHLEGVVE